MNNTFKNKTEAENIAIINALADVWHNEGSYANELFRIIGRVCVLDAPDKAYDAITTDITVKGVNNGTSYTDNATAKWLLVEAFDPDTTPLYRWCKELSSVVAKLSQCREAKNCRISDILINDTVVYHEDVKDIVSDKKFASNDMGDCLKDILTRLASVENAITKPSVNDEINNRMLSVIETLTNKLSQLDRRLNDVEEIIDNFNEDWD